MNSIVKAGLIAGLVLVVWQTISWMIIPWHNAVIDPLPNGEAAAQLMKQSVSESGLYHFPAWDPEGDRDAAMARFESGPNINLLIFAPNGNDVNMGLNLFISYIYNTLAALIAAFLLSRAARGSTTYKQRVIFVAMLGLFVSLFATMAEWNWWTFPADYTIVMFTDNILNWILAGLVIGKFVTGD